MTTSMTKLEETVASLAVTMQELAESHKETERVLKEISAEADRRSAETDRRLAEISAEADKRSAEADRRMAKLERTVERATQNIGGLNKSIGTVVEMIIVPGVMEKMNELNHNFTIFSHRKEFFRANGKILTEVDLLLESCEAVMAVEVKTHLSVKWVNWHIERLNLLRKNQEITGMKGKTMYAAIAGVRIDDDAKALAEENGMYVIGIEEDTEKLSIAAPSEARVW